MLQFIIRETSDDTIVFLMAQTEVNDLTGHVSMKTIGKMLNSQLCIEGLFNIVLMTSCENGKYQFITQNDGTTTAKSPMDMFPLEIDNDLKYVDDTIREYWNIGARKENKKTIKKEEIPIDKSK